MVRSRNTMEGPARGKAGWKRSRLQGDMVQCEAREGRRHSGTAKKLHSAGHGQPLACALGPWLVLFVAASQVLVFLLVFTGGRLAPLLAPPLAAPAARGAAPAGAAPAPATSATPCATPPAAPRAACRSAPQALNPASGGVEGWCVTGATLHNPCCRICAALARVRIPPALQLCFFPQKQRPRAPHQLGVRSSPSSGSPPGDAASPASPPAAASALPGASPSAPARWRTRWP